jgi:hypothetical protein
MGWIQDILRSVRELTPLEAQVTALGICGKCHAKTLRPILNGNGYRWQQCTKCLTCWVDDERITNSSSTRTKE